MVQALAMVTQTSTALTTSIRQAAGWLGTCHSQAATPAQQQQVCKLPALFASLKSRKAALACHRSGVASGQPSDQPKIPYE